jgi:hypothetical protein
MTPHLLALLLACVTAGGCAVDRVEEGADGAAWLVVELPSAETVAVPAYIFPDAREGSRILTPSEG